MVASPGTMKPPNQITQWVEREVYLGRQISQLTLRIEDHRQRQQIGWENKRIWYESQRRGGRVGDGPWAGEGCSDQFGNRWTPLPEVADLCGWIREAVAFLVNRHLHCDPGMLNLVLFTCSEDIDSRGIAVLEAHFGPNNQEFPSLALMVFVLWRTPGFCQRAAETSCGFILKSLVLFVWRKLGMTL